MTEIIQDLTLLLLVSLPINLLFHKIQWPSIMGYLVAGVLIGPHALGLISDPESVEHLAEIGVILLMFLIGLEFSLSHILKNVGRIFTAGILQLGSTIGFVALFSSVLGYSMRTGMVLGILVGLSSTAIILKMVTDRAEIDTDHGRVVIGVLLFQDICVLPFMLMVPLLGGETPLSIGDLTWALLKSGLAVGGVFFASRLLVPKILHGVARFGNKEHLTLFVILLILGTAWVGHFLGLTMAMGAFIAGMILSESDYQHQISLDILPVKDYFSSIFFISVGMLLNIGVFWQHAGMYLGAAAALILLKGFLGTVAVLLSRYSAGVAMMTGLYLAQAGEFSLILASLSAQTGGLTSDQYQDFLIVALLSMLATPPLIQWANPLLKRLVKKSQRIQTAPSDSEMDKLTKHVIIAGYGMIGQHLSRVLQEIRIGFLVVERDGEKIKKAMQHQAPVLYGDASHRDTLQRAGIEKARVLVVSKPDPNYMEQVVRLARMLNPDIYIMARTRSDVHVELLTAAGANLVIPEEFETSIEIFTRVLREFRIPNNIIEQQVELVRMEGYSMFRGLSLNAESLNKFSTYLTASLTDSVPLGEGDWATGKTIGDLDLRKQTGARLIAVVRLGEVHANPDSSFNLKVEDLLVLFGRHAMLDKAVARVRKGAPVEEPQQDEK
ncbi:MAG: potassium transporter Kef [Candidatus Nitronauta litoralis]|uniref:Potassium transporter Kef n=1 Tax=Candidatus Nitronauta litoralis TaxID=2705533 RepID=A0A7T0BUG3_9BACT|nr:MAG: potassium transporter Kef [Candidatus Nitronauta litoralis]